MEGQPARSREVNDCKRCGRVISRPSRGSLSSWLFRPAECQCESDEVESAPVARTGQAGTAHIADTDGFIDTVLDNKYKIQSLLSHDVPVVSYKALHIEIERTVTIKLLQNAHDDRLNSAFRAEAKNIGKLRNSHIVDLFDFGFTPGGQPYIVCEYFESDDLATTLVQHGVIPYDKALDIFCQCAEALQDAHEQGIIHERLNPSNIRLRVRKDGRYLAKLTNFGNSALTAYRHQSDGDKSPDAFRYQSPEQKAGHLADERSDVYSLGLVMWETLTGKIPNASDPTNNPESLAESDLPPPAEPEDLKVRSALRTLISRCLERRSEQRYQRMSELVNALQQCRSFSLARRTRHPFLSGWWRLTRRCF